MKVSRKRSYALGYRNGREMGWRKGWEDGSFRGYHDTIRPAPPPAPVETPPPAPTQAGRALVITPSLKLPSLEIIVSQPLRELKRRGAYEHEVKVDSQVTPDDIARASVVVFVRSVEPEVYRLLTAAHSMGKRSLYVIDDHFLELPRGTQIGEYYAHPQRRETYVNFLRNANFVLTPSQYFADYIRANFTQRVVYFPASVDFELVSPTPKPLREDGPLIIGYEGTSKPEDFAPVVPALKRILNEFGDKVKLHFHGFLPSGFERHPRVEHVQMNSDYRAFLRNLDECAWDIGLAPLGDNLFNNCKTNNKFREYSACYIPGVYSQSPVYTNWVVHGETGISVTQTEDSWYEGIKQLIVNPALRDKIRLQAGALARQHFSIQACADNWLGSLLRV